VPEAERYLKSAAVARRSHGLPIGAFVLDWRANPILAAVMSSAPPTAPNSFRDFYPQYLAEHASRASRRLHITGTSLSLLFALLAVVAGNAWWILAGLVQAYTLAWIGHFFFEHNRPATFRHPLWSFAGDWRMWWDVLRGRVPL
jgi:hypothetical protein